MERDVPSGFTVAACPAALALGQESTAPVAWARGHLSRRGAAAKDPEARPAPWAAPGPLPLPVLPVLPVWGRSEKPYTGPVRALFFLEPLVLHNRPFHYWAWLGHFGEMAGALRPAGWDVRLVANEALAGRSIASRAFAPDEVAALGQESIRRLFAAPNGTILEGLHRGTAPRAAIDGYAAIVRGALGDFVPDVVLTLTPAAALRAAYPEAVVLATETAAYSRAPFPTCVFFDPAGLWDASVPAVHAAAILEREPSPGERSLADQLRTRFGRAFRAVSPFVRLEAELRSRCPTVALLPLQFGGEPGFDCNGPFRNQGEYLFHVLENLPDDVALLVVEHPTAHWVGDFIDEDTRAFVVARYPNVRFVDFREVESAGQVLLGHVDFVIALSSSLGLQAVLFGKPLVAVGTSHLTRFATVVGMEGLTAPPAPDPRLARAAAWLLSHYFVPLELCRRPGWLGAFFERSVGRGRRGEVGLDFFDPIAADDELERLLFATLERLAGTTLRGRVANGDFAAWSRGPGPFAVGEEGPDGWHLLDFAGGVATACPAAGPGGSAVTVCREKAGAGATFFLSRVPDAASCAGAMARLRFRARSDGPATIFAYLYLQIDDGNPGVGTQSQPFVLGPEWLDLEHVAPVPPLGARRPGTGSHVEVVFSLPPEAGPASFELAEVVLEPFPL